ncbi:hypothetical protein BGX31_000949 [Mortierella sp. GBA43]|nr:hypothetical protein BGX31_000949 [Mortierella sp. GBA43]
MHVTCAQREGLMTKGKDAQLFCDVHRDKVALHRIMKKKERSAAAAAAGRSSSSSGFHRSTKNGASYREISSEDDYDDDDDDEEDEDEDMHGEDDDIEEDEDDYRFESDDQMHQAMLERNLTPRRRNTSAPSTSISPTSATGPRGHTKNTRSLDSTDRDRDRDRDRERRRKDRSPESEEIDVDDTEAVLGSSTLSAQRKKFRTGESGSNKESAAESQRRRLLMNLDKKKRQGSTSSTSLNNLLNMPIRTLGGVGVAAGTGPAGAGAGAGAGTGPGGPAGSHPSSILGGTITNEPKQKLPGISRYNSNAAHSGNNHAMEGPANLYGTNGMSPSVGSAERFPGNGYHQTNGRGVGDGSGRNHKGGFDVESVIDATNFKAYALGSAAPSPIAPNFTNTGVSVAAPTTTTTTAATTTTIAAAATNRSGDKQKRPSRSGPGAMGEDPKELQATIQSLTEKVQQLQQQLANQSGGGGGGSGGSGPQQANDAHEKSRNWTLRQNLREVFGVLQLPVVAGGGGGGGILEYHPERLDEYVQALRDAVVRSHPSPAQDSKRRNMVVDKVLRELADMDVS